MNPGSTQLYGVYGHHYDLHTPPHHYQHDHAFLIQQIQGLNPKARILDIGCGSGVFLEKALKAGLDPIGIDPAPAMLKMASQKVGNQRVRLMAMEDLEDEAAFEAVTALSWALNYARNDFQLNQILTRVKRALTPGGRILLQVAHAAHAPKTPPDFIVDREPGPGGAEDIVFRYRFSRQDHQTLRAEYHFACRSTGESFEEVHLLYVADAHSMAAKLCDLGFRDVRLLEDSHGQPFLKTFSPFLLASLPHA